MIAQETEPEAHDRVGEELRLALLADLDSGFAGVVRAYERVVYSVALRLSSRPADAEDLAADAFLHAYRALRGYDAERISSLRLRPWLLTIVRNAARDAARRPGPPPMFEPAEQPDREPSVEEQIEQDGLQRELGSMMLNDLDPVAGALAALASPAPVGLADRIFGNWLAAPSRLGEVYVAFTGEGVQFVRSVESIGGDADAFAQAYRDQFGRPLRPAEAAPTGLLSALQGIPAASPVLDLGGLSDFARDVLTVTRRIPAGEVRPYGWIAREVGRPHAVRAVGSVLARNPVPLLIPCHRVVRSDGRLGDYMFGPTHKAHLLRTEHLTLHDVEELARQFSPSAPD